MPAGAKHLETSISITKPCILAGHSVEDIPSRLAGRQVCRKEFSTPVVLPKMSQGSLTLSLSLASTLRNVVGAECNTVRGGG